MSKIINCMYIKRFNYLLKNIQNDICELNKDIDSGIKNPDIKGNITINGNIIPKKIKNII